MMYIMMHNPALQGNEGGVMARPDRFAPKILELHWHIGEPKPAPLNPHNGHLVVAVQADGAELARIEVRCNNLPYAMHRHVQTWRGEMAQFIVDNVVGGR